jgi:predicted nucleic acid-binding protein
VSKTPPSWLEIVAPSLLDATLKLGTGETEAICVARELHADLLLIDERKGAAVASGMGLAIVGTLNILAIAAEKQLLDLGTAIAALRQTTFREPKELVEQLLELDRERKASAGDGESKNYGD